MRCDAPAGGIERMRAWFAGAAFARHRHDTYAIGITESGVQSFRYRGAVHSSVPGQAVVLHPDEPHDGYAGSDAGFGYRIIYLEPACVAAAVGALPFLAQPVVRSPRLVRAIDMAFGMAREPLATEAAILAIAEALMEEASGCEAGPPPRLNPPAVRRARELLDAATDRIVRSDELEAASGLSRFELARQFRAQLGTSPHRYALRRRLDAVRERLGGRPAAELALEAGFADQAHFTRAFKAAFGLTPGRYAALRAISS